MKAIQNTKDLILHLLYASGTTGNKCEPIRGRTRLQKMIFLFEKEVWKKFKLDSIIAEDILPEFNAYDFGPFSKEVYDDINFLVTYNMVKAQRLGEGDLDADEILYFSEDIPREHRPSEPFVEHSYSLSPIGKKFIEQGEAGKLSANQQKVLDEFKKKVNSISLEALLEYVYTKYPEMTTKSKIKDKVLSSKKKNIEELF